MKINLTFILFTILLSACTKKTNIITVSPKDDLQTVIDAAAKQNPKPTLLFSPGRYFPHKKGQALIALNAQHDGLILEGNGEAILSAENVALSDSKEYSHPAIVSHVLYLGDGVTEKTKISGFTITGAHGFLTHEDEFSAEPNRNLKRRFVFYTDGGGIKIFGNSYPVLENLVIEKNRTIYCGGGISVEQMGMSPPVHMRNIVVRDNIALLTGAGLDLLPGSNAIVENSRFEANKANEAWIGLEKTFSARRQYLLERVQRPTASLFLMFQNSSAITIFKGSSIQLSNSVIEGNSGGIDYNMNVSWYWQGPIPIIHELTSRIVHSQFRHNRIHQIKKDSIQNLLVEEAQNGTLP